MVKGIAQRASRIGSAMAVCLGLVIGLAMGSMSDDADAARRPLLKTLWAVVGADGGIVAGESKGVVSSSQGGVGSYGIVFDQDVSRCAKLATLKTFSGEISTDGASASRRTVEVKTRNSDTSTPEDKAFYLAVHC